MMAGSLLLTTWVVVMGVLGLVSATGAPVVIAVLVFCPAGFFCLVRGLRWSVRGMHEAAEVVATSSKVAVPLRSVERFDAWVADSKYSRGGKPKPQ